jgi:hypothetical protein
MDSKKQRITKEDTLGRSRGYRPISAAMIKNDASSMSPVRLQSKQN